MKLRRNLGGEELEALLGRYGYVGTEDEDGPFEVKMVPLKAKFEEQGQESARL